MIGAATMRCSSPEVDGLMAGRAHRLPDPDRQRRGSQPARPAALGEADLVACEDTRRAGRLYERLEIDRPRFVSNHEGNEAERAVQLAQQVERGARVVLISDAGTPAISDPGYPPDPSLPEPRSRGRGAARAVRGHDGVGRHRACRSDRWRFEGFLPRRAGELERVLRSADTVVAFESPRRLPAFARRRSPPWRPNRSAAVCRELTKLHEEVARGPRSASSRDASATK